MDDRGRRGAQIALTTCCLLLVNAAGVACSDGGGGSDSAPVVDVGDASTYAPAIDPANFVDRIDNPYLPLETGSRWVYEGTSDGESERTEVVVTAERKVVQGVSTTVVRDTVSVDGEVVEDTYDWYAQDRDGNVWYFGEAVQDFENGRVVSTAGSWEAGVDGAQPGIVMLAEPRAGASYRQEYYAGEAEDMAEVLRTDDALTVPTGSYTSVVVTEDWTPLEPDVVEEKAYAPGVGQVRGAQVRGGEGVMELVELTQS